MRIGSREVGPGHPPYVIAEIGVNHDGEVARALELTKAAADAGADAVKLQYFETDRLMSKAAKLAAYQKAAGEIDPIEMLRRLELSLDECTQVIDRAHELGIHAIVTVFSLETVEKALRLPWDAIKTASPDVVNYPLLRALEADGRPMIVSTGATTFGEIEDTIDQLYEAWDRVGLLHCVSCYPTPREHASLFGLLGMTTEFAYTHGVLGYSDHTPDVDIGAMAVQIGACLLEKHLTYDQGASGPDHAASLDVTRFAEYVRLVRDIRIPPTHADYRTEFIDIERQHELARQLVHIPEYGVVDDPDDDLWCVMDSKRVLDCEQDVRAVSRQSIVATRDLPIGHAITRDDLTIKRPGTGLKPWRLDFVVGARTARAVERDVPLFKADLEGGGE